MFQVHTYPYARVEGGGWVDRGTVLSCCDCHFKKKGYYLDYQISFAKEAEKKHQKIGLNALHQEG